MKERIIQVVGTWGVGGTCRIEGTNEDGWDNPIILYENWWWAELDIMDTYLSIPMEAPYMTRPHVIDGDETTNLTILMLMTTASHV